MLPNSLTLVVFLMCAFKDFYLHGNAGDLGSEKRTLDSLNLELLVVVGVGAENEVPTLCKSTHTLNP